MNICALSTAKGGAIAVIRVSGPDAISIVSGLFVSSRKGKSLNDAKGQTLHYGTFVAPKSPKVSLSVSRDSVAQSPSPKGEGWGGASSPIDDVLVSVFRAPHSYTGENAVEISCHG
ncbi:MAG: tRNA uridine-5-carboxymethylaminomethyl(34) synthesis GTPase MnmE, partial [Prevotella sp.]|nr:tRNA uridine-5-carboxymethylaminomethyl(34) synthesis GTPase MnmE [Prevotella sp.]